MQIGQKLLEIREIIYESMSRSIHQYIYIDTHSKSVDREIDIM